LNYFTTLGFFSLHFALFFLLHPFCSILSFFLSGYSTLREGYNIDIRKGRRPSFTAAAPPSIAEPLVERFKEAISSYGIEVADGVFGAHMYVNLVNDGPVTIWMDSEEL
jgi:hypothetical protein